MIRNKTLENSRWEAFALFVAKGETAEAAYASVYKTTAGAAKTLGARLLAKPQIRARVGALRTEGTKGAMGTRQAAREALFALWGAASTPPVLKIKAIEADAKLAGWYKQEEEAAKPTIRVFIGGNPFPPHAPYPDDAPTLP